MEEYQSSDQFNSHPISKITPSLSNEVSRVKKKKTSNAITSISKITLEPVPPLPVQLTSRLVPITPGGLESSFEKNLNGYNEARRNNCVSEITDWEEKLILVIGKVRNCKMIKPALYPKIVNLKAIESMIELLRDENCGKGLATNILLAFQQLTDVDYLEDGQVEQATAFVKSLVSLGALDVFVSAIGRFPNDEKLVFRAVQTIAQMIFREMDLAKAAAKTKLVNWLLEALGDSKRNVARKHAVGLLDTLLMSCIENKTQLGRAGTVPVVVDALSSLIKPPYSYIDDDYDEEEKDYLLETMFRSLLILLEASENKVRFADAGGIELMIEVIKNEELSYAYCGTAIEALDIALRDCQSASDKFANDASGLDIVFPAKIPPSLTHGKEEIEEHLISLISSLLTGGGIAKRNNSILLKFIENDCQKLGWLMELSIRYCKIVEARTNGLKEIQSELYSEKRRYGLSTLQSITVILDYLLSSKNQKIEATMSEYNSEMKHVQDILSAYQDNTGNVGESSAEKKVIEEDIDSFEENLENPDQ